ncbi:hypothetical protein QEN19_003413 [Hanseniaspora menglaensis]
MGSLKSFIKNVKDASTPKKERDIINKESAKIRTRLKDDSVQGERRRTYISKLLYLYILGERTDFGQVDCINLLSTSSSSVSTLNYEGGCDFENKRLGYLGVILLLKDENQELLTLITNVISQDIYNKYIAGLTLECLGSLTNKDLARDLCSDLANLIVKSLDSVSSVDKLLTNTSGNSGYLIKHSLSAASSLLKQDPNLLPHFLNVDNGSLIDKIFDTFYGSDGTLKKNGVTHGVLLSIVDFVVSCFNCKNKYDFDSNYEFMIKRSIVGPLTQKFISFLNYLAFAVKNAEYEVNGITDPFLQCSLLQALRTIFIEYRDDIDSNTHVTFKQTLMKVMNVQALPDLKTVANSGKKSAVPKLSLSVKYETIRTILMISYLDNSLKSLAVDVLVKFLSSRDPNHKYVAMKTLAQGIQYMDSIDEKNLRFILACVYETDISIKRRSLEVIFEILQNDKLANQVTILNHLVEFLSQATSNEKELINYCFRKLIDIHVLETVENSRFLTRAILYCGFYLKNEQIDEVMVILNNINSNASVSFIKELIQLLFSSEVSKEDKIFFESNFAFKVLSVWCMGEYGSMILESSTFGNTQETSQMIVDYFYKINNDYYNTVESDNAAFIINYLITAVAKVSTYINNKSLIEKLRQLLIFHSNKTGNLIISIKSNQLLNLFSQPVATKRQIFAKMPHFKAEYNNDALTFSKTESSLGEIDLLTDLLSSANVNVTKSNQAAEIPLNSKKIFQNGALEIFYHVSEKKPILDHEAQIQVFYKNISGDTILDLHSFVAVGKTQTIEVGHISSTTMEPYEISKQHFKILGQGHLMTRIKLQYKNNNIPIVEQFDYKFDKSI